MTFKRYLDYLRTLKTLQNYFFIIIIIEYLMLLNQLAISSHF